MKHITTAEIAVILERMNGYKRRFGDPAQATRFPAPISNLGYQTILAFHLSLEVLETQPGDAANAGVMWVMVHLMETLVTQAEAIWGVAA